MHFAALLLSLHSFHRRGNRHERIVECAHFPGLKKSFSAGAQCFSTFENAPGLRKSLQTLLDWIKLLVAGTYLPKALKANDAGKLKIPMYGALLKNERDVLPCSSGWYFVKRSKSWMRIDFFLSLKNAGLPVSVQEYLVLCEAMKGESCTVSVDDFYYLSRTCGQRMKHTLIRFDRLLSLMNGAKGWMRCCRPTSRRHGSKARRKTRDG